jgi:hypothetical protein
MESIEKAVINIWNDLCDRSGIGGVLDSCDEEIQLDIQNMIRKNIKMAVDSIADFGWWRQ